MAEPQDMKGIRDLLDSFTKAIANAGVSKSAPLLPGAVIGIAKAVEFVTQHIDHLEERIRALESQKP